MSSIDPGYFENELFKVQDKTWSLGQGVRTFDEDWSDIFSYWNDSAAVYVRDRYIVEIQQTDAKVLSGLSSVTELSKNAAASFLTVWEKTESAYQYSCEAVEYSHAAQEDLVSSQHAYERSIESIDYCVNKIDAAQGKLDAADRHVAPLP